MKKVIVLVTLLVTALVLTDGYAATRKQKPQPASQKQKPPAPQAYGPGCKNQGASIMSGGCVN